MKFINRIFGKIRKVNDAVDDYQEKITFSQANVRDSQADGPAEKAHRNLIVASNDDRFSQDMIEYAMDMAKRMGYGIIAVNAANITREMTDFFSMTYDALCKDFSASAQKNIMEFKNLSHEHGIEFIHAVKFSGTDRAIKDVTKEYGRVEFIISKNQENQRHQHIETNENRTAQHLCVYSLN